MRLFSRTTIALLALLLSSFSALGWGLDGHRATGAIADLILQKDPAGDAARELLGTSLSEAATWMDCVKGACHRPLSEDERAFVQSNPQQSTFHYTDVPIQQPQYKLGTAGTRNDDAVQVAKRAINVLRGKAPPARNAAFASVEAIRHPAVRAVRRPLSDLRCGAPSQLIRPHDRSASGTLNSLIAARKFSRATRGLSNVVEPNGQRSETILVGRASLHDSSRLANTTL
jgi:hypothetical protein